MWRDILMANRDEVLAQASSFRHMLGEMERALVAGDAQAVMERIAEPSKLRSAWEMSAGMGSALGAAGATPSADETA